MNSGPPVHLGGTDLQSAVRGTQGFIYEFLSLGDGPLGTLGGREGRVIISIHPQDKSTKVRVQRLHPCCHGDLSQGCGLAIMVSRKHMASKGQFKKMSEVS